MCLAMRMRALAVGLSMAAALVRAGPASAASTLFISGGGDGHGIGMSQYGAYGYALNGWNYQQILAHYYTGTALAQTSPSQTVRVLLGTGSAASASTAVPSSSGPTARRPSTRSTWSDWTTTSAA